MSKLTDKQTAFINEYLQCWNATEAALKAGYSTKTAYSIGHENLKKPEIAEEIQKRIAEMTMQADEALIRLGKHARGSMADFLTIPTNLNVPLLDWHKAEQSGMLDLVKKITMREGEISFELYDAQSALKEILKQSNLTAGNPTENMTIRVVYEDKLGSDN